MWPTTVEAMRPFLHGFSTIWRHTHALMRSRLAYTLSFWLLGAVALSVLAMGGLTAWNLRLGFSAYLQARDLERFDKFVDLVQVRMSLGQAPLGGALSEPPRPPDMSGLLRELAVLEGVALPSRRPPPGNGPPPGGGLPAGGGDGFGARVALARPDGRHWAGPPIAAHEPGVIQRAIQVGGASVALALLRPRQRAPEAHETQFLRSQYLGIAGVASALLLLALACAVWLARQWVRPLAAVQAATARIAQGELDVRIPIERSDEIGDVVRNVNAMAESLQRIEGSRRRWLADLSHELRTPLAVLRGEIEALVDGVRPLNAAAMRSLRDDVLRLGALVDDLHSLAIADLNALPCHFANMDALQTVRGVLERHAGMAAKAGLALHAIAGEPVAMPVHWDAARIEQLLGNLLQNSLRYTDAPGTIKVAWRAEHGHVHLTVEDTAPGVPDADLARLFEPLYRADAARSRERGGSGLGLAICEAIAQAHGGRIMARKSTLGGLCIEVVLPCVAQGARR